MTTATLEAPTTTDDSPRGLTNALLRGLVLAAATALRMRSIALGITRPDLGYVDFMCVLQVVGEYTTADAAFRQWKDGKKVDVSRRGARILMKGCAL